MSTDYPYSQRWRERTEDRIAALRLSDSDIEEAIGIAPCDVLDGSGCVSLDESGPIDELLDKLEEQAEARALELPDVVEVQTRDRRAHRVRRVDVDLGPLTNCDVKLWGPQR